MPDGLPVTTSGLLGHTGRISMSKRLEILLPFLSNEFLKAGVNASLHALATGCWMLLSGKASIDRELKFCLMSAGAMDRVNMPSGNCSLTVLHIVRPCSLLTHLWRASVCRG